MIRCITGVQLIMGQEDGHDLLKAARYLRGAVHETPPESQTTAKKKRQEHFLFYRSIREKVVELWYQSFGIPIPLSSTSEHPSHVVEKGHCFYWWLGVWHCGIVRLANQNNEEHVQVHFLGLDKENDVIVPTGDPRMRCTKGDHVRIHYLDSREAALMLHTDLYLCGVIKDPDVTRGVALVEVAGLAGPEFIVVPNVRMEHACPKTNSRVESTIKDMRDQLLRQVDIATSAQLPILVVKGSRRVVDQVVMISLWAHGDKLLVRVNQPKGDFTLEASALAVDALGAAGVGGSGLTILTGNERGLLLECVTERLSVSRGVLTLTLEKGTAQSTKSSGGGSKSEDTHGDASKAEHLLHMDTCHDHTRASHGTGPYETRFSISQNIIANQERTLEGILVKLEVECLSVDRLTVIASTISPEPERIYTIFVGAEGWEPLEFPSLYWLDLGRTRNLAIHLLSLVEARDGSPVLVIAGREFRPEGFIPMISGEEDSPHHGNQLGQNKCTDRDGFESRGKDRSGNGGNRCGMGWQASSGVESERKLEIRPGCMPMSVKGLCRCKVLFKSVVALPGSMDDPTDWHSSGLLLKEGGGEGEGFERDNGIRKREKRRRWLVVVHANGGLLTLSFFTPTRLYKEDCKILEGGNRSRIEGIGGRRYQLPLVSARWSDWVQLGYGPLQWLSHAQKKRLAELTVTWAAIRSEHHCNNKSSSNMSGRGEGSRQVEGETVVLWCRSVVTSVVRAVRGLGDAHFNTSMGDEKNDEKGMGKQFGRVGGGSRCEMTDLTVGTSWGVACVEVRDEGHCFRIAVSNRKSEEGGLQELESMIGEESWGSTGSRELLWLSTQRRKYLAYRLSHQVAVESGALVVVQSPVHFWYGTVTVPRLGDPFSSVHLSVLDVGQEGVLIEACNGNGCIVASATVPLKVWIDTMKTPLCGKAPAGRAFHSRLENEVAGLLGAGCRSLSSGFVAKRLAEAINMDRKSSPLRESGSDNEEVSEDTKYKDKSISYMKEGGDQGPMGSRMSRSSLNSDQKRELRLAMLMRMIDNFFSRHGHSEGKQDETTAAISTTLIAATIPKALPEAPGILLPLHTSETGGSRKSLPTTVDCCDRAMAPAHEQEGSDKGRSGLNRNHLLTELRPSVTGEGITSIMGDTADPHGTTREGQGQGQGTRKNISADAVGDPGDTRGHRGGQTCLVTICQCCGNEGGLGHGKVCLHRLGKCGPCRIGAVGRLLGILQDKTDKEKLQAPTSDPDHGASHGIEDNVESESEYEWITDTEDSSPEYRCDGCGCVMGNSAERYHCVTCSDFDLCQSCFLSPTKNHVFEESEGSGGQDYGSDHTREAHGNIVLSEKETYKGGSRQQHLASHQMQCVGSEESKSRL